MKLIKLLNNPLFHQAEILAGKECLDKEFTSISTGSSIRNIPDFLMVYTGRNYEEPWSEYLERAKGKTAAAILLIGYRKSEFDLTRKIFSGAVTMIFL